MKRGWIVVLLVACGSGEVVVDAGLDASNDVKNEGAAKDATVDVADGDGGADATSDDDVVDAPVDTWICNPDAAIADAESITTLATQQNDVAWVVLDDASAYWTTVIGGAVVTAPIGVADASTALVAGVDGGIATGIAVTPTRLYWGTLSKIMTCTLPSCTDATAFVTQQQEPWSLVADGTNLYWTDFAAGNVEKCALAGCGNAPTVLASNQKFPFGIAIDSANVYWATEGFNLGDGGFAGQILKCATSGCGNAPTVLATDSWPFFNLATDGNDVYWFDTGRQAIVKCAVAGCGGVPSPIIASGAVDIAVDGTNLYWTTGMLGELRKCPLSDCCNGVTVLASEPNNTTYGLAVNATNVALSLYGADGSVFTLTPK
jgi:hypothetical protein